MKNFNTKYVVRLTLEDRSQLEALVRKGKIAAAKRRRAQILLKADAGIEGSGLTDEQVAEALDVGRNTVHRVRKAFVEQGLDAAITPRPARRHVQRKLDGAAEAQLIALVCGPPPEGRARWTMQLLADKLVELKIVDAVSDDTVHRTLKKTTLSRG